MIDDSTINKADEVLRLSADQVKNTLRKLGHTRRCSNCNSEDWVISTQNGTAGIVNLPLVNLDGLAHWAYYLTCDGCGAARLIDVAFVERAIRKGEESNG